MQKVIPVENGFAIKSYDAQGNSLGVSKTVYATETEAIAALEHVAPAPVVESAAPVADATPAPKKKKTSKK